MTRKHVARSWQEGARKILAGVLDLSAKLGTLKKKRARVVQHMLYTHVFDKNETRNIAEHL